MAPDGGDKGREEAGRRTTVGRRTFLVGVLTVPLLSGVAMREGSTVETPSAYGATGAPDGAELTPGSATGAAVQEAIDQAHRMGGGVVRLGTATYLTDSPLRLRSRVALVGSGPGSVVKAGPGFLRSRGPLGGHPLITTYGASDVTVSHLTADQSGDVLDGDVPERLTEFCVDGRFSTNLLFEQISTRNPFSYSIAVVASSQFRVRGCRTRVTSDGRYDQLDGIHVLQSSHGDVVDNDVDQGGLTGDGDDGLVAHTIGAGDCHDLVYRDNRVRGGRHGAGMQFALGAGDIFRVVVRNNLFYGSPRGIHVRHYGGGGALRDVTVGGSPSAGNSFRDNAGPAVDLRGRHVERAVISNNAAVASGEFFGPTVRDNTSVDSPLPPTPS